MNALKYGLCVVSWIVLPVHAQKVEKISPQPEGNPCESLRIENEELQSTVAGLNKTIIELTNQLREKSADDNKNRWKKKADDLKKEKEVLVSDTARLAGLLRKSMEQHEADRLAIAELQQSLDGLSEFKVKWLAQLAGSVGKKWLSKAYSEIDMEELRSELGQYEQYAGKSKDVEKARDTLNVLWKECDLYVKGRNAVNAPYEEAVVNGLKLQVNSLMGKVADAKKKGELEALYWQLNNYQVTIKIFQKVIKAVEGIMADYKAPDDIWDLVKATLNKQETDKGYISALKEIPWLSAQYDIYYDELEKDCWAKSAVRDQIMSYFQE